MRFEKIMVLIMGLVFMSTSVFGADSCSIYQGMECRNLDSSVEGIKFSLLNGAGVEWKDVFISLDPAVCPDLVSFDKIGNGETVIVSFDCNPGVGLFSSSIKMEYTNSLTGLTHARFGNLSFQIADPALRSNCSDSDGGLNLYMKGSVTGLLVIPNSLREDVCIGNNQIREMSCNSFGGVPSLLDCPYGCKDGACVKEQTLNSTQQQTQPSCTDSDNGENYYLKGAATGTSANDGSTKTLTDYCDGNTLKEAFCSFSTFVGWKEYSCPNGCEDGACVKSDKSSKPSITDNTQKVEKHRILHRVARVCASNETVDIPDSVTENRPGIKLDTKNDEQIVDLNVFLNGGYWNFDCKPRYFEHCIGDGSFDVWWDEWCEYKDVVEGGEVVVNTSKDNKEKKVVVADKTTVEVSGDGCFFDSAIVPFGIRLLDKNDHPVFCNINKQFKAQKPENSACQNNYECLSNSCLEDKCVSLVSELRETRGMLEKIKGWFKKFFGAE